MEKVKKRTISILKEIIIIVIGVLIAVWINDYKEQRSNQQFVSKTLFAIESEIEQSKTRIEKVLEKHIKLLELLQKAKESTVSIGETVLQAGGLQYADTPNIGLRFFVTQKADLVSNDIIARLSALENGRQILGKKMDKLLEYTYNNLEKSNEMSKTKYILYLANVIESEQSLFRQYKDYLKQYGTAIDVE